MKPDRYLRCDSPLGEVLILAHEGGLTHLHLCHSPAPAPAMAGLREATNDALLGQARDELVAYFDGTLRQFTVPLAPQGTLFQQQAWAALQQIPYGQTRSYGEQARTIGQPSAVRAIGAANGRNPIAILIPCHRVIGAQGALTGYAGGLEAKAFLLRLEGAPAIAKQGRLEFAEVV
jgi:methylated-DNA-[protein]-cysteine S-methyltransferase